jgi:two-component system sensor histidine kinase HydH
MKNSIQLGFDSRFQEKLRLLSSSRIFIAFSLLFATLIIHPGKQNQQMFKAFLFVVICHVFISIGFFFLEYILTFRNLFRFTFMQIVWDILFHTSMVYLTGGISSQFKFLYWLSIFYASILFLRTGALVSAILCSFCYAVLIDLEYFESLPKLYESFSHFTFSNEREIIYSIVLNSFVFIFVGLVGSAITTKLHLAETAILDKERIVEDLKRKVTRSKHLASIGEMAARLAHEIRNPLTSVSASMELLSKKDDPGSNEMMILNIAKKEAKRLNQLLTDFLDYAKPSMPEFSSEYLSSIVKESIQVFQHGYPDINVDFENKIESEKKLQLDTRMLSQLFWNVFKNAAEAMEGKGKIDVKLSYENNFFYVIEISDEGEGFKVTDKEKMFEPFFSSKVKGTGLGLSIAYRIMEDHRGLIELENSKAKGTICRLSFPTSLAGDLSG